MLLRLVGKSTLGNLLTRLYDSDGGAVKLDGVDITTLDGDWLRGQVVGIVSQEPALFSGTVAENIAYSEPNTPMEAIKEAARAANAASFIESFPDGYDTLVGERGVSLSGGQRQRLAIARALIKVSFMFMLCLEPTLLFCEGPTSLGAG